MSERIRSRAAKDSPISDPQQAAVSGKRMSFNSAQQDQRRSTSASCGAHPCKESDLGSASMLLTTFELEQLTGRKRATAQARALLSMGISHRVNAAGNLVVSRQHVEAMLGAVSSDRNRARKHEPNWEALGNA